MALGISFGVGWIRLVLVGLGWIQTWAMIQRLDRMSGAFQGTGGDMVYPVEGGLYTILFLSILGSRPIGFSYRLRYHDET